MSSSGWPIGTAVVVIVVVAAAVVWSLYVPVFYGYSSAPGVGPASIVITSSANVTSTSSAVATTASAGGNGSSSGNTVAMPPGVGSDQSLNFQPASLTVAPGTTVTWKNLDSVAHTVTSTSVPSGAKSFNSGNMPPGATFQVTLTVPGTYHYYCTYHSWMVATVTVS